MTVSRLILLSGLSFLTYLTECAAGGGPPVSPIHTPDRPRPPIPRPARGRQATITRCRLDYYYYYYYIKNIKLYSIKLSRKSYFWLIDQSWSVYNSYRTYSTTSKGQVLPSISHPHPAVSMAQMAHPALKFDDNITLTRRPQIP